MCTYIHQKYVYVCVCIRKYMSLYILCVYIYTKKYICEYEFINTHKCMYFCINLYINVYINIYKYLQLCKYIYMYEYIYILYMYTYIYLI